MGTWGPNTFENDSALDWLGHLFDQIVQFIQHDLVRASDDNDLERQTLAAVAVLARLVPLCHSHGIVLESAEVAAWKHDFLRWFDRVCLDFSATREFIDNARASAMREFDNLTRVIEEVSQT